MKSKSFIYYYFTFLLFLISCLSWGQKNAICNLTVDYKTNPLGIDNIQPQFAWKIKSNTYNISQSQYQLLIGTQANFSDQEVLWDSGKIDSNKNVNVLYQGPTLESNRTYFWKVKVWTNGAKKPLLSQEAFWSMGLLNAEDWSAQWIGQNHEDDQTRRTPYFQTDFNLKNKPIERAYLHITAKGMYEAYLNGKRVGDAFLTPGWTSYDYRLQYQTYDITPLLNKENTIGVSLGSGWYRGYLAWGDKKNLYGDQLGLRAQLMVRYQDGTQQTIGTDQTWTYSHGAIIDSEIYNGEIFNALLIDPNWTKFGYRSKKSKKAIVQEENVPLIATANELIKKHEVFEVKEKIITPSGDLVLDFGQNLVGWVAFQHAGSAGDSLHIYHAEILDKDGEFYTENLRAAKQKNTFILNGNPEYIYEPHFTFQGFRYIKIEGDTSIDPSKFKAIALYSALPKTGSFETSNALINQLQHNIEWGQKGNFLDVPTDCPQRDERLGWTGDAQAFYNTATFNRNVKSFFDKWFIDLALDQREDGSVPHVVPNVLGKDAMGSAGWADAATIIPWNAYLTYGDLNALKMQYPSMKKWVRYMEKQASDGLYKGGFHFGDWLFYRPNDDNSGRAAVTSKELIAQSFFVHSIDILSKAAKVLGFESDFTHFSKLLNTAKKAYQYQFITSSGRLISETQTAYVLALQFDLLPEDLIPKAVDRLVANIKSYNTHLTTGFLGTPFLCHVLSNNGRDDIAIELLLQKTYPSWLYPVTQGATTIWERWDGLKPDGSTQTPSMNSYNHYAYGAIGEWMYNNLLGFKKEESSPGFKKFTLKPLFSEEFSFVKGHYENMYGRIAVEWSQDENTITLAFGIPANTQAKLDLSLAKTSNLVLFKSNKKKGTPINAISTLGSGNYEIILTKE